MLLNVRVLGASGNSSGSGSVGGSSSSNSVCDVEASLEDSVESLKRKVETKLNLGPNSEPKLLFRGKTLQDGTNLSLYKLTEGSKLHCMVKKDPPGSSSNLEVATKNPATNSAGGATEKKKQQVDNSGSVDQILYMGLRRYFETDADTRKVVTAFKQNLSGKLSSLSADDIERICLNYNTTNKLQF